MQPLTIDTLRKAYRSGSATVRSVVQDIRQKISADNDPAIFIHLLSESELEPYLKNLEGQSPETLPLYGIPFAIKDNIDLAGVPTTAACPDYAYTPEESSFVVDLLIKAGAIPIGKTNLDQFATGLVGVRSPYGVPMNPVNPGYIPGGSSSGSAVAVARGYAAFSLGTDTAGSGRVPAAFNELIGLKPSRGLLSNSRVIPACRSLDCVSIFSNTVEDARQIFEIAMAPDPEDSYSREWNGELSQAKQNRIRIGIPKQGDLEFFGNGTYQTRFLAYLAELESREDIELVTIAFAPFVEAAKLLYHGPWIAERDAAVGDFIKAHPESAHPITRKIIESADGLTAADAFRAFYRLQKLKKDADAILKDLDCILTPTTGTHYSVEAVMKDPVETNTRLGYYTNFMNLLDYSAIAIPAGRTEQNLAFGVTLFSRAFQDRTLLDIASRLRGETYPSTETGVEELMELAVCGAHMKGLPLNHQLLELGATFNRLISTASNYRFYCLEHKNPIRPGLVRSATGSSVEMEIWNLPKHNVGAFLSMIQEPLGLGSIETKDGKWVYGFLCETHAVENSPDITSFGNWRSYLESLC